MSRLCPRLPSFKYGSLLAVFIFNSVGLALDRNHNFSKKNVCSITINSDDEINTFRQYLPADQFNFIELTQFSDNSLDKSSKWLSRACAQGIKCDILLISGHFGGAFFGSSSKRLSLEDLETASCNSQCHGILSDPKEVFLFGCNTLAGKNKDSRSPEEYHRILIQDGFTEDQAARIVAFRYSPIGESFHDRMSQVFSGVQRIYGFNSVAPVGPTVKPLLQKYLSSTTKVYSQALDNQRSLDAQAVSAKLLGVFSKTSMIQTQGFSGEQGMQRPACFLNDKEVSNRDKLLWVDSVVRNPNPTSLLNSIIHIETFISRLMDKNEISGEEQNIFSRLSESQNGKAEILGFLKHPIPGLQALQVNLLSFAKDLGWVAAETFKDQLEKVIHLKRTLQNPIRSEYRDFVCSLKVSSVEIDPSDIPSSRWNEELFISLLGCLKIKDEKVKVRVANHLWQAEQIPLQLVSLSTLKELNPQSLQIHNLLLKILATNGSSAVRSAAAETIGSISGNHPDLRAGLLKSLQSDRDIAVRQMATEALAEMGKADLETFKILVNALFKDNNKLVRAAAARSLGHMQSRDVELHKFLLNVLAGDDFIQVKRSAAEALSNIRPEDPTVRELIEKELQKNSDAEVREFLSLALK